MTSADPALHLRELLAPICARIAELDPAGRTSSEEAEALEEAMAEAFPPTGEHLRTLEAEVRRGVDEGWLCDRGAPEARFSRIAKAEEASSGLSIDCVSMLGEAVEHTHPQGELTIGFPADPAAREQVRFEGRPAGWVFLPPGSRHIPKVTGGRMHLVYFLPAGAVEWHM